MTGPELLILTEFDCILHCHYHCNFCDVIRYMSILHPLRPVIPRGRARWVILGIWILSSAASIPNPVLTQYMQDAGQWVCTNGESIQIQTVQLSYQMQSGVLQSRRVPSGDGVCK